MWQAYQHADPALEQYIKSSPPMVATRVMTGLQLLNATEANASVLKVAVQTLYSCRYSGCAANRYIHGEKGALAVNGSDLMRVCYANNLA